MVSIRQINPVARAVVVIAAVMALVTSVTFAALQSQATLTNNSISTATAGLKLWNGSSFESTAPGFTVTGLVPGEWSDDYNFYFQNDGEGPLFLTANVPQEPALPEGMDSYGFTGWENLKVAFKGYCAPNSGERNNAVELNRNRRDKKDNEKHANSYLVKTDMAALLAGEVELPCGPLAEGATGDSNTPGTAGNYSVSFKLVSDAVNEQSAGVGNFDVVFNGSLSERN